MKVSMFQEMLSCVEYIDIYKVDERKTKKFGTGWIKNKSEQKCFQIDQWN